MYLGGVEYISRTEVIYQPHQPGDVLHITSEGGREGGREGE